MLILANALPGYELYGLHPYIGMSGFTCKERRSELIIILPTSFSAVAGSRLEVAHRGCTQIAAFLARSRPATSTRLASALVLVGSSRRGRSLYPGFWPGAGGTSGSCQVRRFRVHLLALSDVPGKFLAEVLSREVSPCLPTSNCRNSSLGPRESKIGAALQTALRSPCSVRDHLEKLA